MGMGWGGVCIFHLFILKIYSVVLDDLSHSLEKMISIIISFFPNEFICFKSLLTFSLFFQNFHVILMHVLAMKQHFSMQNMI